LEKYKLTNLTAEKAGPVQRNTDVTDAMIKGALLKGSPFMIASLVVMVWLVRTRVRSASTLSSVSPPQPSVADGLPTLPESLRVVSLPLLQYSVNLQSVIAFDKETTLHTNVHTSTSGGQVYTVGNQVHSTPIQTSTSVTTTQKDLIWVRTADKRETSWTFTGGAFKVRPGQIISGITQDGRNDFMLVYNHNTGQLEQMDTRHGSRGGWAWLLATLAGSIGFAIAVAILLSLQPNPEADAVSRLLAPVVDWIMGVVPAAIIAFIIEAKARGKLAGQRDAEFQRKYLPQFRQFLEQCTPALQKYFTVRESSA
jgi:hypothetical protein